MSLYARVVMAGRSSMRIAVEAWRRARDSDANNKFAQATFTFVATDGARRSRPLPVAG